MKYMTLINLYETDKAKMKMLVPSDMNGQKVIIITWVQRFSLPLIL